MKRAGKDLDCSDEKMFDLKYGHSIDQCENRLCGNDVNLRDHVERGDQIPCRINLSGKDLASFVQFACGDQSCDKVSTNGDQMPSKDEARHRIKVNSDVASTAGPKNLGSLDLSNWSRVVQENHLRLPVITSRAT